MLIFSSPLMLFRNIKGEWKNTIFYRWQNKHKSHNIQFLSKVSFFFCSKTRRLYPHIFPLRSPSRDRLPRGILISWTSRSRIALKFPHLLHGVDQRWSSLISEQPRVSSRFPRPNASRYFQHRQYKTLSPMN